MPDSARWLMSRAVCHVAELDLRLSREQECMRIRPVPTRPGLDTCRLRTPAWVPQWVARTPYGGSGSHSRGPVRTCGGPRLSQTWRPGPYIQGSGTGPALSHGVLDSLLMPWSISLSLDLLWPRTRPCGGVRRCWWPRVVARGWGESWPGPTYNSFTTRLKRVVWVLHLHTVLRGTLVSRY
jgi:hypothetical protein